MSSASSVVTLSNGSQPNPADAQILCTLTPSSRTGLVPASFALTGPVAGAIGPANTLIGAGLLGSVLMGGLIVIPGVRDPERSELQPDTDATFAES